MTKSHKSATSKQSRLLTLMMATVVSLSLISADVWAARMGGGRSFGRQSPSYSQRQSAPPEAPAGYRSAPQQSELPAQAARPQSGAMPGQAPVQTPTPQRNRWLGPLAGVAAGIGLVSLFSHFGMGGAMAEGMGSLMMLLLLVVGGIFVFRMLRGNTVRPASPTLAMQPAAANVEPLWREAAGAGSTAMAQPVGVAASQTALPANFDADGFLRSAKVYFIRLQAAWDTKNLADIREYTTPEMFAEISMQINERGNASNKTDVVTLNAQLLGVETMPNEYLASVEFDGMLRETEGGAAQPFRELWHLSKPISGNQGWLLAGIQQVA